MPRDRVKWPPGMNRHPWRTRYTRLKWKLRARLGRCRHEAQLGPAGADEGWCAICGAVIPWGEE